RRFMAYLVYIHGTRGIMWYAYGCGATKYRSEDYPEQWEYMKKLASVRPKMYFGLEFPEDRAKILLED
ncbi:MAG: hypothetical protein V2A66_01330, partial [Pseudomonadota bacterium]